MSPDMFALLSRIAGETSHTYHRTHPWLDREELKQEAWVAMLQAMPLHVAESGPLAAYLATCAYRACKRLCWRMSVPANVPMSSATPQKIARLRASTVEESALEVLPGNQGTAAEQLESIEQREALAQLVAECLAQEREPDAIRAVIYGEMPAREAAETFNVPVQVIYRRTEKVRAKLRARAQEVL